MQSSVKAKKHVLTETTSEVKTALNTILQLLLVVVLLAEVTEFEMSSIWREWITQALLILLSKLQSGHIQNSPCDFCHTKDPHWIVPGVTIENKTSHLCLSSFRTKATFHKLRPQQWEEPFNVDEFTSYLQVILFDIKTIYFSVDSFCFLCMWWWISPSLLKAL